MDLGIQGKKALILAGSKGLGGAIAEALASEGVEVAIIARSRSALDERVGAIAEKGGRALGLSADLTQWSSIATAVDEARRELGSIDILVLNTGGPPPTKAAGIAPELWDEYFQLLVLNLVRVTDMLLPGMRERGWGRIMHISAPGVITPSPGVALSQALRSTIGNWLKTLAAEVAAEGVTVNTLIPGMVETQRLRELAQSRATREGRPVEEILREQVAALPARRAGHVSEFGATAAFLASQQAAYITGSRIAVDGGWITAI
jgi:3-oxoacyl-[acyl-carrier protein] reductase